MCVHFYSVRPEDGDESMATGGEFYGVRAVTLPIYIVSKMKQRKVKQRTYKGRSSFICFFELVLGYEKELLNFLLEPACRRTQNMGFAGRPTRRVYVRVWRWNGYIGGRRSCRIFNSILKA